MERQSVEFAALAFQALVTALLALVYLGLWRHQKRPYFLTWTAAWAVYALRLAFIIAFLRTRNVFWLFSHQVATGTTAFLLLIAALQFSRGLVFRRRWLWTIALVALWAWTTIYLWRDFATAGISAAVTLSAVTLWTGIVFWRRRKSARSQSAAFLGWIFILWGLHHLDYPLLRPLGTAVLFGVFADVFLIGAAAIGALFLALSEGRHALEARNAQLEQLTRLLLHAQEDERRRVSRELHDEAGQVLSALKIELDLDGRHESSALVGRVLGQIRNLSDLLRPRVLDDLGLIPAMRTLVEDFGRRTRIAARFEGPDILGEIPPGAEVALYRVVQEALTNVARHARASSVVVRLAREGGRVHLSVEDDGRGLQGDPIPHLGLLGIRERIHALSGEVEIAGGDETGVRLSASIPVSSGAE